jgi:hypothetical protein
LRKRKWIGLKLIFYTALFLSRFYLSDANIEHNLQLARDASGVIFAGLVA